MRDNIESISQLKNGDDIVVTITGKVQYTSRANSAYICFDSATENWRWYVDQNHLDDGSAAIERIHLKEYQPIEPGVYEVEGRPEVYYIVSKTGKVTYVNTVVNICRPYPSEGDFRTAFSQGLFRRVS